MRRWWGLCWLVLVTGCGEGGPPLDELPLRDALQGAPAVVGGLPAEARSRLATRLEAARTSDLTTDRLNDGPPTPEVVVGVLDRLRVARRAEPLLAGIIADGLARPMADPSSANRASPATLPPIEGDPAGDTAPLEARALDGAAGATVRTVLAASGAQHLWRVTGWPIGAIAINRTVYVNASWLVALAPVDDSADGGPDGGWDAGSGGPAPAQSGAKRAATPVVSEPSVSSGLDAARPSEDAGSGVGSSTEPVQIAEAAGGQAVDGGIVIVVPPTTSPLPPPPSSDGPSFLDACGSGADACDSTDTSSCDGTDDGSDDSCSTPPDEGDGCQVARGGHRTRYSTVLWLLAPLGFLLGRRP